MTQIRPQDPEPGTARVTAACSGGKGPEGPPKARVIKPHNQATRGRRRSEEKGGAS